jgi:hypothetical protein
MLLNAQLARQHDPAALKHWTAPLYWQPAQASSEDRALAVAANTTGSPANANPLVFVAMPPCRIVDTRASSGFTGAFGPPSLVANATRTFPVLSNTTCPIPSIAQAYSFEISVVPPGPLAYITAFPTGEPSPVASIAVESPLGYLVSNTGIIPGGTNGSVDVYASNATDLVIDINGYYASLATLPGSNTAFGTGALASNTTGIDNTASGFAALASNTTGSANTADGISALASNTTGGANTAVGYGALQYNTTGAANTASGNNALAQNTTGLANTASGFGALGLNTTGGYNTASGAAALQTNTTGSNNTASGSLALSNNTTGNQNTATGGAALQNNTTGSNNTATGYVALEGNTTGVANTANGESALGANATGSNNTALGDVAMANNGTGSNNTAIGAVALGFNGSGGNNIAIGYLSASRVSAGNSNNIHIGSQGAANDSGVIRIGSAVPVPVVNCGSCGPQTSFFAAGIRGITTGNNDAIPVVIDSNGQLGTVSSSRRFKEDIQDMDTASSDLMWLRPVTFRYQKPFADGSKPIQYGLIAEEVAEVYPDLVAHSADGQIETVKYQVLDSMLLNELQKEHQQVQQQAEMIRSLESRLAALEETLRAGK